MYKRQVDIDAQVTFEDGRTGSIQATLAIRDVTIGGGGQLNGGVRAV